MQTSSASSIEFTCITRCCPLVLRHLPVGSVVSHFNLRTSFPSPLIAPVMDQTHARALEALQPFIYLANSNSATCPRFVANIIMNATSSPQTYVFAELLETPTVQSLRSPDTPAEYQGYLKLLEIFAWGTWQEYQGTSQATTLHGTSSKLNHLAQRPRTSPS